MKASTGVAFYIIFIGFFFLANWFIVYGFLFLLQTSACFEWGDLEAFKFTSYLLVLFWSLYCICSVLKTFRCSYCHTEVYNEDICGCVTGCFY